MPRHPRPLPIDPPEPSAEPDAIDASLAAFRFDVRRFIAKRDDGAARAGLTAQHHQALVAIKGFGRNGRLGIGELASRLLLRHHTVVELADRLANLGLVHRSPDPGDGRRVLLTLTDEGDRRLRRLDQLDVDDLKAIRRSLNALLAAVARQAEPKP